ncbi:hypothetical protein TNCV_5079901 [Trichonephila clavipes]|nr:hypothetical protein TNCV_5079901 [Trichonephila clavipes]
MVRHPWCRHSQPGVAIWLCVAVAKYGLALSSINRSPGHFFRIAFFNFDWVPQYHIALIVPTSKKSSNKIPWASQKTVRSTLPAEEVVLNFFRTGDDGFFLSFGVTFTFRSEMVDP